MLQPVDLLQLRHAHRAARALQELIGGNRSLLALARELAEAELEDARHAGRAAVRLDRAIELRQVAARPEVVLELIGLARRARESSRRLRKMMAHEVSEARSSSATTICTGMLAWTTRRMMESCPFIKRYGQVNTLVRDSGSLRGFSVCASTQATRTPAVRIGGSSPGLRPRKIGLLEPDRRRPIGVRLAGDGELIVEPRRPAVLDGETDHREHDAGLPGEGLLRVAERPQPLRARPLQEAQIVRIIDYPAPIGILPVYTGRPREDAHRPSSNSDSEGAARSGGFRPKCR